MINVKWFPWLISLFLRACSTLAAQGVISQCCQPCLFPSPKSLLEKSIQGDCPHQAGFIGSRQERKGNIFTFFWNTCWKIYLGKKSAYAALVTVHVLWIVWNPICFFSAESWSPHERSRQTDRQTQQWWLAAEPLPDPSGRHREMHPPPAFCQTRWVRGKGGDIPSWAKVQKICEKKMFKV